MIDFPTFSYTSASKFPTSELLYLENIFDWILKKPMIEETSSKLLWYKRSDKEVNYYNPSAHFNVQRLTKLLTEQ